MSTAPPTRTSVPRDPTTLDGDFAEFAAEVRAALGRHGVPGGAIALHYYGRQWATGIGVTNVDHPLPADESTIFQAGGITKLITALAVLRLAARGQLELDNPVRAYWPALRLADSRVAERVTVRHLLNHTAGWYGDDLGSGEDGPDALARYVLRLETAAQLLPLGGPFSYNDSAFSLAGRLIEIVTGQPFAKAIQTLVFEPLGMIRSSFFARDVLTMRHAVGHEVSNGRARVNPGWTTVPRVLDPAGGLCASALDLLQFGRAMLGGWPAHEPLSEETLAALREPTSDVGVLGREDLAGFAAGTMIWQADDGRYYGQVGSTQFQNCRLVYHPEADFALVMMTNGSTGELAIADVLPRALEQYTGIVLGSPPLLDIPAPAEYSGRFGFADSKLGPAYTVTVRDGVLRADLAGETRLALIRRDTVVAVEGPARGSRAEFVRDLFGGIGWFRLGGRAYPRLR
ncbi:MAG: serine hydrolase domain-containing protein [Dehalococcoidia bacterium]